MGASVRWFFFFPWLSVYSLSRITTEIKSTTWWRITSKTNYFSLKKIEKIIFICSIIFIMYWLISLEDAWCTLVSNLFYASVLRVSSSWYYFECNEFCYCSNDLWTFWMVCLLVILFFNIFKNLNFKYLLFHKYLVLNLIIVLYATRSINWYFLNTVFSARSVEGFYFL